MASSTPDDIEQRQVLLDSWVDTRREIARLQAREAALLGERLRMLDADVAEFPFHRDAIMRSMIAEYSAAGHVSKGSVEYAVGDARALQSGTLPGVQAAFTSGAITAAHVREIIRAGQVVDDAVREGTADAGVQGVFDAAAVVIAEQDTPARTRAHLRQLAAALAGRTLVQQHKRAAGERTVTMRSVGDGLALLSVVLPEHLAVAILDRLTQLAHEIIATRDERDVLLDADLIDDGENPIYDHDLTPDSALRDDPTAAHAIAASDYAIFGNDDTFTTDPTIDPLVDPVHGSGVEHVPADTRTIDQVRADLLTDLLLASDPTAAHGTGLDNITARIQVTIAATTLAGADEKPAELDGHGPIHPDAARALAGRNTGWSRLFLNPTGMVTETDTYTPTAGMRRHLRARDQHCRFPGCRMPIHRCQIDHNHDHAKGGTTALNNLSHFCTGHHALKHPDIDTKHRWDARQLPDGTVAWTSPLGNTYTDPPPRRVMFT